jgi:uncharacterized lipoprotein YmbA
MNTDKGASQFSDMGGTPVGLQKAGMRLTDKHGWRRGMGLGLPLSVLGLLITAGCNVIPQAQTDPTRFYVLSTPAAAAAAFESGAKAPAIHLRPVELASYIKSKPMIVRRGDNEIEFREYARWGEPLELGIGRVLREELLARGAAGAVLAAGLRAFNVDYDYELTVRVLTCEGNTDGAVQFRAVWELSTTGAAPQVAARGDYRPTDLKWDGKSEATLASQLSQAVAGLAAEIAGGLAKAR